MTTFDSGYCITLDDVQTAASRIKGIAHKTPVLTSSSLDRMANRQLYFKVEALQKTGSFKFRGALNAIRQEVESRQNDSDNTSSNKLEVVTHSSGNHAQAVALAAKLASTPSSQVHATIVMPSNTPDVKRQAVQDFGATIVMVANTNEARETKADEIVVATQAKGEAAAFVHPSEDPRVIAGQGTVCFEFLDQVKELGCNKLDAVIIPVGGGGLASGNIITLRSLLGDQVKIILAEPSSLDDAKRSFDAKTLLSHDPSNPLDSVADGLKTTLGPNTWPIVRDLVDDIYTVTEAEILRATKLIWERLKVCIEPSAGVGIGVALSQDFQTKYPADDYKKVGIILCGGNVDILKIAPKMQQAVKDDATNPTTP